MLRSKWRVIGRHNRWVTDACITETSDFKSKRRKFTATIYGWRGFKIWEGPTLKATLVARRVIEKVREIKKRIESNDNKVFEEDSSIGK